MTSLQETLPILDQAVPALPGKVEAVAREADTFEKAAREAIVGFQETRAAAEGLVEQVRHALEALRDQAASERQDVEEAARALRETAEREAQGVDEGAESLPPAADHARSAMEALESHLEQGADHTRSAHEEAQAALDALDDHTRTGQADLQHSAEQMTTAVGHVQEAITEGQAEVAKGVNTLAEAMTRMLERVQIRLERTFSRFDELRDEQSEDVADTLSGLVSRREQIDQKITARLQDGLSDSLDPEMEALVGAWNGMGTQVAQLDADCQARREELEPQFTAASERIEPLQGSVAQVKQAAEQVGIAWP